jgi:hypothetical protein
LVVNLSSEEVDDDLGALDTSRDEDLAYKLFGNLNWDLLGPPGDNNIIVISDFEEEEVREDDRVDANVAPSSLKVSPTPSASTVDNDDAPKGV